MTFRGCNFYEVDQQLTIYPKVKKTTINTTSEVLNVHKILRCFDAPVALKVLSKVENFPTLLCHQNTAI